MVLLPGPANVDRPRAPRDPGLPVDQSGVQNLGNTIVAISRDIKQRQQHGTDSAFLAQLDVQSRGAARTMQEELFKAPEDPDRTRTDLFQEQWQNGIDAQIEEAIKATGLTPSQAAREIARNQLTTAGGRISESVAQTEAGIRLNTINDTVSSTIDSLALGAFNEPESLTELLDSATDTLADMEGTLPADTIAAHMQRAQRNITVGAVRGLINQDPSLAIAGLESGEFDEGLTAQSKDTLLTAAKTARDRLLREQASAATAERQVAVSDLEIAVRRGEATTVDIEAAFDGGNGFLTPAERTRLTKSADNFTSEETERAAQIERVETAGGSSPFLDPRSADDRNAVEAHYDAFVAAAEQSEPPATGLPSLLASSVFGQPEEEGVPPDAVAAYVSQVGIVPPQVRSEIRGTLRVGTPDERVASASLLSRIEEAAPFTRSEFDTEDFLVAETINRSILTGASPSDAVERADRIIAGVDTPERQARDRNWRDNSMEDTAIEFLSDEADRTFSSDVDVPDGLSGSFVAKVRRIYNLTGDIDVANTVAWSEITRIWGVTEIGEKRYQQFAPEAVYDNGQDPEWMADQLEAEFAGRSDEDFDRISLQADPLTLRSNFPNYIVMMKDDDGVLNPVIEDGLPLRWRPDWATSPAAAEIVREQGEDLEQQRRTREINRETGERMIDQGLMPDTRSPVRDLELDTQDLSNPLESNTEDLSLGTPAKTTQRSTSNNKIARLPRPKPLTINEVDEFATKVVDEFSRDFRDRHKIEPFIATLDEWRRLQDTEGVDEVRSSEVDQRLLSEIQKLDRETLFRFIDIISKRDLERAGTDAAGMFEGLSNEDLSVMIWKRLTIFAQSREA